MRSDSNNNIPRAILICGLSSIFVMLQFSLQVSPGIMIPSLMKDFSIDIVKVSILSSSYFYTYLILQAPSGVLVDRFGPKRVLVLSIFFSSTACLMFCFTNSFYLAICIRMLMGLGSAPAISVAFDLCARWLPPRLFALAIGMVEAVAAFGIAIVQYLLGIIVESHFGWRGAIFVVFISGFILLILVLIFVKDGSKADSCQRHGTLLKTLSLVIKKPQAWFIGVYSGLMFIVIAGLASLWCIPYIQELYKVSLLDASIGSSSIFCGAAMGAPFSGWLSDIIGKRKSIMYIFSFISLLISIFIIYYPPYILFNMYLLLMALGFFCGSYMIPFALMRDITSHEVRGTAMGFTNMMCILFGAPIFQPAVSLLLSYSARNNALVNGQIHFSSNDYQLAFMLLPISFIVSILILFFVKETYCESTDYSDG